MKFSRLILVGLILTFIFNYDLIFNIGRPIHFEDTDYPLHLLIIKNTINSTLSGEFSKILTLPIFYPTEGSIAFSDSFFIQSILYFPIYLLSKNIIFTYNLLVILNFFLSFLSMYFLIFYLTKRSTVAIIASVIFAFNPFTAARYPTAVEIHSLLWIPLIFLFIEKSFKNPSSKNIFLVFLFLTCQLLSTLYYSVFLSLFLPIYFLFRIIQLPAKGWSAFGGKFLNIGFLAGLILLVSTSFTLGSIYYNFYSKEPINRGIEAQLNYSAEPIEFFSSQSPRNFFYNFLRNLGNFPKVSTNFEHHVFLGWSVIIFLLIGFLICLRKKQLDRMSVLFLSLALLSLILALGPRTFIYGLTAKIDPLFAFIRAPARFVVFFFFFAALSVALLWVKLFKNEFKERLIFVIFLLIVILEYFNLPVIFQDIPQPTRQFYQYLDSRENIQVIAELPIGVGLQDNKIIYRDGPYLLFASTLHSKKLLNGYSGYIPQDYSQKLKLFNTGILTKQKLTVVKKWGVDAIILHKSIFKNLADFEFTKNSLDTLGIPVIKKTQELYLYDLTDWRSN